MNFTYSPVQPLDREWPERCWQYLNRKSIPPRSLGYLEEIAVQVATIQRTLEPDLGHPSVVIAAGDHGVYAEKVSYAAQEVTWQHSLALARGEGAACLLARQYDLPCQVVDVGVKYDFPVQSGILNCKVVWGTENIALQPGMSVAQTLQAMDYGRDFVRLLALAGQKGIILGEMGIANTTPAAALTAHLLGLTPQEVVGEGTGLSPAALENKRQVVGRILARHKGIEDPIEVMAAMGGAELAFIAGAALEAAGQGLVVLVDGVIVTAALLVAQRIDAGLSSYPIAGHQSPEPAHKLQLEALGLRPILKLGMRLGEASGALVAWPIVRSALTIFRELSTCAEEGMGEVAADILAAKEGRDS